ncbi:MAG: glycosyltransferase family 4 protein [Rhodovulum sp.]
MNLLILSRYDRRGASSRLRMMQYVPALEQAGFTVILESLFDAAYLDNLYSGRRNKEQILAAYRRRIASLRRRGDIDLIWLEKEALPWVPAGLELALFPKGVPVVADYDDAVFHRYDQHPRRLVRGLLGDKIGRVMQSAQMVLAGNTYLGDFATKAGAARVEIVPTVVDTEVYDASPRKIQNETVTVGWIGTPESWRGCVQPLIGSIRKPVEALGGHLLGVGIGKDDAEASWMDVREWSETREVSDIRAMDIGIMPLPDTLWMWGKCGYKLIQYMACGLPVVASPVGVNTEIVEHGVNGFLAETDEDWRKALETLIGDPALRERMGKAGRKKVETWYSLQVQGPRVAQMLAEVARNGRA